MISHLNTRVLPLMLWMGQGGQPGSSRRGVVSLPEPPRLSSFQSMQRPTGPGILTAGIALCCLKPFASVNLRFGEMLDLTSGGERQGF